MSASAWSVRAAGWVQALYPRGSDGLSSVHPAQTDYLVDPDRSLTIFHNRPELKFEFRPIAGKMHCDRAGIAEIRPQRRFPVKVEVYMVGNGSDLRWRRWQVNERNARKVGVNDLIHLGIGADLEELRKLLLDFDEGPTCSDFENKCGVAE